VSAVATPSTGSLPDFSPAADGARESVRSAVESTIGGKKETPKGLSDALKRFQSKGEAPAASEPPAESRQAPKPTASPATPADRGPDGKFAPRKAEPVTDGRKAADIVKPGVAPRATETKAAPAAPAAKPADPSPEQNPQEQAQEPARPWFADAPDQLSEMAASFWQQSNANQPASPSAPAPAPVTPAQAPAQSQTQAQPGSRFTVAPEQFRAKLLEQYGEEDPIVQHLTAMDSFVRELSDMRDQSVKMQQQREQQQRQQMFTEGYSALTGYLSTLAPKSAALAAVFGDGRTAPTPQQKAAQMDLMRSSFSFLEYLKSNGVTDFTDDEFFGKVLQNSRFKHLIPAAQAGSQQDGADPRRAGMDVASTSPGSESSGSPMDGAMRIASRYIRRGRG